MSGWNQPEKDNWTVAFSIKFAAIGSSHNKRYSALGKTTTIDCDNYIKLISLCHNNIRQRLEIITMRQLHTKIFIVILNDSYRATVPRRNINYCVDTNNVLCHHQIVLIKSGHLLGTIKLSNIKSGNKINK